MEPIFRLPPDLVARAITTPLSETVDWSLGFLGLEAIWKRSAGRGGLIVILDTGVDEGHPDLAGQIVAVEDFSGSFHGPRDVVGHGTHCAGTAFAAGNNNVGVKSPAYEAKGACGKVLGDSGAGEERAIVRGIDWATELARDYPWCVLSMSFGGPTLSEHVHEAIGRFVAEPKRVAVAAAGNDGERGRPGYPSVWDECICVAAGNRDGTLTRFSSRSPRVDVVCPGERIVSTMPGGGYAEMSGTSMATPIVASVAACILAADALDQDDDVKTWKTFRALLRETAVPLRDGTPYGMLNPAALLDQVTDLDEPPAIEPEKIGEVLGYAIWRPARAGDAYSVSRLDARP